jgi:signal transduction histidine kinase
MTITGSTAASIQIIPGQYYSIGAAGTWGGGSLAISAEKSGGQIRIAVADRGEGIPEDKRQAVVERFVRLDASRAKPGLGLGLSLVAAIARLHGGELRLEDNATGLKAVLVLPEAVGSAGRSLAQGPALPEKGA